MEPAQLHRGNGGPRSHTDLEVPVVEGIQLYLELQPKLSPGSWKNTAFQQQVWSETLPAAVGTEPRVYTRCLQALSKGGTAPRHCHLKPQNADPDVEGEHT